VRSFVREQLSYSNLAESTEDGWADLRATKWLTERVRGQGEPIVSDVRHSDEPSLIGC
jgi:hypothetical protein